MGAIYDESAVAPGEARHFPIGGMTLYVHRAPNGDWMVDAGGTDVVRIRAAKGGGFDIDLGERHGHRSAFPAAIQLAMRRLGF
jgi:hypothetical protein